MAKTLSISDTMIGSLTREADGIRRRCTQVTADLNRCQNKSLFWRLIAELKQLEKRRLELRKIANLWSNKRDEDLLEIEFLIEISKRPLLKT